jgi:hypothetical protein
LKPLVPNGGGWRIREETNENLAGANDQRILQGTNDVHTVASPHESAPGVGDFGLVNLDIAKVYNLSLLLERTTEVSPGDTITASLTATDRATGISYTLSKQEATSFGIKSDSWDYFAIRNTGTDDYDFVMDNFKLELFGSNAVGGVPGDYNNNGVVDMADYVLWRSGGPLQNEVDTPGTVNAADYTAWRARFGNTSGSGSSLGGASVPEPGAAVLLLMGSLFAVGTGSRGVRNSRAIA